MNCEKNNTNMIRNDTGILYVLTDGKGKYIRYDVGENQYVVAKGKFVAERWEDRTAARNVLKNSVPKHLRKKFKVIEIEDDRVPTNTNKDNTTSTKLHNSSQSAIDLISTSKIESPANVGVLSSNGVISSSNILSLSDCNTDSDYINTVQSNINKQDICENPEFRDKIVDSILCNVKNRKSKLLDELSTVDKKICDVLHYIEFNKLNACNGYKAYRMIRDYRLERRVIKNECEILDKVCNNVTRLVQQTMYEQANKKYNPRELPELFLNMKGGD